MCSRKTWNCSFSFFERICECDRPTQVCSRFPPRSTITKRYFKIVLLSNTTDASHNKLPIIGFLLKDRPYTLFLTDKVENESAIRLLSKKDWCVVALQVTNIIGPGLLMLLQIYCSTCTDTISGLLLLFILLSH